MTCRVTPSGSSSPVARKRRRRSGATTNCIAEWKHDLGAAGFCLKEFFATEAAFRAISLLFNLLAEGKINVDEAEKLLAALEGRL